MNYEGEKFLLKLYRELYAQENIKHSGKISDNKYELINKYLNRLEKTEKVFLSDNYEAVKFLKNRYYDKYVIKREEITSDREDTKEKIIKSQKESLEIWIDYLMKEDKHPMWSKYWAFQGMLKLGQYDKDNKDFTKRSKRTTSPYIELNKKVLKQTMDIVLEHIENHKPNDKTVEQLIENGSFGKIYAYYLAKQIKEQEEANTEEGIWKKYRISESKKLVQDLNQKNTGWCITSEAIAKNYLEYGTMHIYYTKDINDNYTIPRICIRQEDINVVEVKGILDQKGNLEYSMIDVAIEKLKTLNNSDDLKKIGEDIKKITTIVKKNNEGIVLSIDDLRFLYEIDKKIKTFTAYKDSRIKKILKYRNPKEDLSKIFECDPEKISTNDKELQKDNVYVHYGNINLFEGDNIKLPPIVIGDIYLNGNTKIDGINNLQIVAGSIDGENLITAENFTKLEFVAENLNMPRIKNATGLENLQIVKGIANFGSLENATGLEKLKETGSLCLKNLKSSKGLENLQAVNGSLDISNMKDIKHLKNLRKIEKNVICYASNSIDELTNLKIKGDIHFYHMINIYKIINKIRKLER